MCAIASLQIRKKQQSLVALHCTSNIDPKGWRGRVITSITLSSPIILQCVNGVVGLRFTFHLLTGYIGYGLGNTLKLKHRNLSAICFLCAVLRMGLNPGCRLSESERKGKTGQLRWSVSPTGFSFVLIGALTLPFPKVAEKLCDV